jgi:hypothetical protein
MECNKIIEELYKSKEVNELIGKIEPESIREDLRQELAIILLNYDCDKLKKIKSEGNLIGFVLKIVWNMSTWTYNDFYKTYKKNNIEKAIAYMESLQQSKVSLNEANLANRILQNKLNVDPYQAHESMIFQKYVELRSCKKVADYFGVPSIHIFEVVRRMKKELKSAINKTR